MRKSRVNDLRKSKRNGKNHTRLSRKIRGGVMKENPFLNFARKIVSWFGNKIQILVLKI